MSMSSTSSFEPKQMTIRPAKDSRLVWPEPRTTRDGDVFYRTSNSNADDTDVVERRGSLTFQGVVDKDKSNNNERGHHARSLSGHFQDATKLSCVDDDDDDDDRHQQVMKRLNGFTMPKKTTVYPTQEARGGITGAYGPPKTSGNVGKKHRRLYSGGATNPHTSHRRLDSTGFAEFIDKINPHGLTTHHRPRNSKSRRSTSSSSSSESRSKSPNSERQRSKQGTRHRRSDSAGLDLLSVAANVSQGEDGILRGGVEGDVGGIGNALKWNQPTFGALTRKSPTYINNNNNEFGSSSRFGNNGYVSNDSNDMYPNSFQAADRQQDYHKEVLSHGFNAYNPSRHHHQTPQMKTNSSAFCQSNSPSTNFATQSYYPPPQPSIPNKQPTYPVQQQQYTFPPRHNQRINDRSSNVNSNVSSSGGRLDYPLTDSKPYPRQHQQQHQFNPHYSRQTSFQSIESEGKIETDEALFSNTNNSSTNDKDDMPPPSRVTMMSPVIPRVSPKLFEQYLRDSSNSTCNNDGDNDGMRPFSGMTSISPLIARVSPNLFAQYIRCSPTDLRSSPQPILDASDAFAIDSITTTSDANKVSHSATNIASTDLSKYDPVNMLSASPNLTTTEEARVESSTEIPNPSQEYIRPSLLITTNEIYPHQSEMATMPTIDKPSPASSVSPTCTIATVCSTLPPTPLSWTPSSSSDNNVTPRNQTPEPTPRRITTGTVSKRIRRKCSINLCPNRVVQGGLCIAHGAKRKTCGHPGCTKHVKKAGMCSAHGPARKRCDVMGCQKVSVQAGRCISHGAKKKLCSTEGCQKQAILSGMCKRHNDEWYIEKDQRGVEVPLKAKEDNQGHHHRRGLSFFQDMSTVDTIINGESVGVTNNHQDRHANVEERHEQQLDTRPVDGVEVGLCGASTHKRGLSLFSDNDVAEKIIKSGILI